MVSIHKQVVTSAVPSSSGWAAGNSRAETRAGRVLYCTTDSRRLIKPAPFSPEKRLGYDKESTLHGYAT